MAYIYADGDEYQIFGTLPFDHFIATHWDPSSSQTKAQQKRDLVRSFVSLGKLGRKENIERYMDGFDQISALEIPRDLLNPTDRDEEAEKADKDYAHLVDRVFEESPQNLDLFHGIMFNSREEFYSEQPYTPSSTRNWLLSALCHYPDIFDGAPSTVDWHAWERRGGEKRADEAQRVIVFVADEEACKKGNVLIFGINHKGQILLPLIRAPACRAMEMANSWIGNRESLEELGEFKGEECYYYAPQFGPEEGWAES